MVINYIIDTHAWVEYFVGSDKGEVLKKLFLNKRNNFFTVECCLAEIKGWALKSNKDFEELFGIVRANSHILSVEESDWIRAAEERFEQRKTQKNFGLIDSVILVKQKEFACKIISGDKHFEGMKNVAFMK